MTKNSGKLAIVQASDVLPEQHRKNAEPGFGEISRRI
jgi:hypothetical protein